MYIENFGKEDDWCIVAKIKEKIVGAVWVRIMNDYSTYGSYIAISERKRILSVQKANYTVSMYRKLGFEVVDENEEGYIMICKLR